MSNLSGRYTQVKPPKGASRDVVELAARVETSMQELYAILTSAQHGNLRFKRTRPSLPQDGDVVISASGSDINVEVWNEGSSSWKSVTLT